jgi:tetratricopeptide (TPR) repeat protein
MAWALILALGLRQSDPAAIEDALRRAKNEYAYGNYHDAIEQLRALLYPMKLTTDQQVIEARKYLALSYYLLDRLDEVGEEFAKLLHLSPDYQLDPYTVAPPVIDMFESIRRQLKPDLDIIRQLRSDKQIQEPIKPGVHREIERTITKRSALGTFLPFGIGQFQNGHTGWGITFAVSEALLLAVNIAAHLVAIYGVGDDYPAEDRTLVQVLTVTQYASLALFGFTWSLGVFHARLHFVPEIEGPTKVREVPAADSRGPPGLSLTFQF